MLTFFRSRFGKTDFDYTEYVFNQVVEQGGDKISTFSQKEYINFADKYAYLVHLLRSEDLTALDPEELVESANSLDKEPFTILVVEEYDDGERSPFIIKRFNTYAIESKTGIVNVIGEGVCHYNEEISVLILALPVLVLFISSFMIPIVSRLIGLISIPENCLDGMTYMIAPLAFIIGIAMPFAINILPAIIGFELPQGNTELMKNLHLVIALIVIFRISPLIGMVLV